MTMIIDSTQVMSAANDHERYSKNVLDEDERTDSPAQTNGTQPQRPPIVYTSFGAFASSFAARWKSLWTRRFTFALFAGQLVSLCITCTNVTTTELVNRNFALPTTQSIFL